MTTGTPRGRTLSAVKPVPRSVLFMPRLTRHLLVPSRQPRAGNDEYPAAGSGLHGSRVCAGNAPRAHIPLPVLRGVAGDRPEARFAGAEDAQQAAFGLGTTQPSMTAIDFNGFRPPESEAVGACGVVAETVPPRSAAGDVVRHIHMEYALMKRHGTVDYH